MGMRTDKIIRAGIEGKTAHAVKEVAVQVPSWAPEAMKGKTRLGMLCDRNSGRAIGRYRGGVWDAEDGSIEQVTCKRCLAIIARNAARATN
jgi:hypothetical protein